MLAAVPGSRPWFLPRIRSRISRPHSRPSAPDLLVLCLSLLAAGWSRGRTPLWAWLALVPFPMPRRTPSRGPSGLAGAGAVSGADGPGGGAPLDFDHAPTHCLGWPRRRPCGGTSPRTLRPDGDRLEPGPVVPARRPRSCRARMGNGVALVRALAAHGLDGNGDRQCRRAVVRHDHGALWPRHPIAARSRAPARHRRSVRIHPQSDGGLRPRAGRCRRARPRFDGGARWMPRSAAVSGTGSCALLEERDLAACFGGDYERYRRAVPCWRARLSRYDDAT